MQVGPSLKVLGEKARKYGLKLSLQERLQQLYVKQGGLALKHMTSLNTNYRCHKGILQIPNRLFYEYKIQACSPDALAHPKANFPLLFVCSSLTTEVDCEFEAELLMKYFEDFVLFNWPTDRWGEKDLSRISITTSSRTQVCIVYCSMSCIQYNYWHVLQLVVARTVLQKMHQSLSKRVKILTTYTIQGKIT